MRSKFKVLAAVLVLPWLAISVFGARYVSASGLSQPTTPQAGQKFTVLMGAEFFTEQGEKSSWSAYRFYPSSLTINVGDTIMFKHNAGLDAHTATFLGPNQNLPDFFILPAGAQNGPPPTRFEVNPALLFPAGGKTYDGSTFTSSGAISADIPGPKEYSLSFTKAGTYQYICLVHTEKFPDGTLKPMTGTVTVMPAGSAYPKTPAQVDADAKAAIEADRQLAVAEEEKAEQPAVITRASTNGATIHRVNAGYGATTNGTDEIDYLRFAPKVLTIQAGDTVEWASPTEHGFHNILFGEEPTLFNFEPQPAGPPKVFVPAEAFFPVGPNVHTGTGVYSAGIVRGSNDPPGPFTTSYALTFTQPGRYEYICALHYNQGMDGTIIVEARTGGGTVGMPRTGNGSGTEWFLPLLAAALLLAGGGVTLRLRSRSVTK